MRFWFLAKNVINALSILAILLQLELRVKIARISSTALIEDAQWTLIGSCNRHMTAT